MLRQLELAKAAGIVDGEGCISIMNQLPTFTLRLEVAMTHAPTICKLWSVFEAGQIYNYPMGDNKNIFMLVATGGNAAYIINLLHPYLYTKQPESKLALQFYEEYMESGQSQMSDDISRWVRYYEQLSQLKKYNFPTTAKGVRINPKQVMADYDEVLETFQGIGYSTERVLPGVSRIPFAIQHPLFENDTEGLYYAN